VKRKNKVGFERESPRDEAALKRVEILANLLASFYEPMLTWRLDGHSTFRYLVVRFLRGAGAGLPVVRSAGSAYGLT
jgi:hypothetical protein